MVNVIHRISRGGGVDSTPLDIFSLMSIIIEQIAMKLGRTKVERYASVFPDTGPAITDPSTISVAPK